MSLLKKRRTQSFNEWTILGQIPYLWKFDCEYMAVNKTIREFKTSKRGNYKIQKNPFPVLFHKTSRERPKSAPYLRLKKTRKPLFPQLETTKALKKLKIEKKNFRIFFEFFSKFPVSRIVPKM